MLLAVKPVVIHTSCCGNPGSKASENYSATVLWDFLTVHGNLFTLCSDGRSWKPSDVEWRMKRSARLSLSCYFPLISHHITHLHPVFPVGLTSLSAPLPSTKIDPQWTSPKLNTRMNTIHDQVMISFFLSFIFISWRLITLQYCSGFCHTLTRISHGFTCVSPYSFPCKTLMICTSFLIFLWDGLLKKTEK